MDSNNAPTSGREYGRSNDIIDIRSDKEEINLLELTKKSLKNPGGGTSTFPHLLLWDEQGLKAFEEITYLDDYYPTHNEIDLLEQYSDEIALRIKPDSMLVELGSGNLRKIKILLSALDKLGRAADYYALDLNRSDLERSLAMVPQGTFQHVRCHGLLGTYDDARSWLERCEGFQRPMCVLSLGSSISSFTRSEAPQFLFGFAEALNLSVQRLSEEIGSTMIVGLDACKSPAKLDRAYNDPHGVWNRFILNGLTHANSLLGYDAFQTKNWTAEGRWNGEIGCYERYLIPLVDVTFENVCFKAGDKLFISHSCKYSASEQAQLWEKAGVDHLAHWTTEDGCYGLHMLSTTTRKH